MTPIPVTVALDLSSDEWRRVDSASSAIEITRRPDLGSVEGSADIRDPDVQAIVGGVRPHRVEATPALRWIHAVSMGLDHLTRDGIQWSEHLTITNAGGGYAVAMAEYVTGSMFLASERLRERIANQDRRGWDTHGLKASGLRGRTVVILGYGSIGREVARQASALGLRVLAVKERPDQLASDTFALQGTGDPDGVIPDLVCDGGRLTEVVSEADFLVVTVPLTEKTRGLVGGRLIAQLPSHAWVINVGRGAVIDDDALLDAARHGRIGGALLDVFAEEPLPSDHPFWDAPNILVTPHVSGNGGESWATGLDIVVENLKRFAESAPLLNVVDLARHR